jgi:hypothetical protein
MANAHVITSGYSGQVLEAFVTKAVVGNDTVDKGLVYLKSGIKSKYAIPRLGLGNIIQDRKSTPVSPTDGKGDFKFDERSLEPQDFMVYTEFNPRDLEKYWEFAASDGKLVFRKLDAKAQVAMVGEIMKAVNEYVGKALWMGRKTGGTSINKGGIATNPNELGTGDYNKFDGFLYKFLDNIKNGVAGDKVKLAGNSAITTGDEAIAALNATFKAIPKALRGRSDLRIVMDYDTWDLYDEYLINLPNKGRDFAGTNSERFRGIPIVVVNGAPDQTIVAGIFGANIRSNFWVGVDYVEDVDTLQVDKLQANSELYFFKMLMKMDVQVAQPSEIVLHTPYAFTA